MALGGQFNWLPKFDFVHLVILCTKVIFLQFKHLLECQIGECLVHSPSTHCHTVVCAMVLVVESLAAIC